MLMDHPNGTSTQAIVAAAQADQSKSSKLFLKELVCLILCRRIEKKDQYVAFRNV